MKLPEKPPINRINLFKINFNIIIDLMKSEAMLNIIRKANKEYDHWETFKYYTFPDNVSPELAWAILKFMRMGQARKIPLHDKNGSIFSYWLPDSVLKELSYFDKHMGEQVLADNVDVSKGEKEKYLINSLMEEAIASSQLEGAATTRKKAKEMLRLGKKPGTHSDKMIMNNYVTITNLKDLTAENLSPELIKRIQAMLTRGTLDQPDAEGRFRKEEEPIQVIDHKDGELLFDPPQAKEIDARIQALCDYVNTTQEDEFTHPVIKAIIIHFWLAYIHPFVDGNGRTARALSYWYLLKHGYWKFEYLAISRIIKNAPGQYARAYLYSENDDQDLTYFMAFNLRIVHQAIEVFESYVQKKQKEIRDTMVFLQGQDDLNFRQHDVLRKAVANPDSKFTIKSYKTTYNVVYETARADLEKLVKKGFVIKKRIGREFYYFPSSDINDKLRKVIPVDTGNAGN